MTKETVEELKAQVAWLKQEVQTAHEQKHRAVDLLEQTERKQRQKKNMDFVQLQRKEMRALSELAAESPIAMQLLMVMAQVMDKQNAVMISFKAMEQIVNRKRPTLDRAIRVLRDGKWIQVVKVGTANAYVLNEAVFWTDHYSKRETASFSAQVITTLEEQDKDLRKSKSVQLKRVPSLTTPEERIVLSDDKLEPPDQQHLDLN